MRNDHAFFVIAVAGMTALCSGCKPKIAEQTQDVAVRRGAIAERITSTGEVLPMNRLEVCPPIEGRIDAMLVKEGDHVKVGDKLVIMSSRERAALIDAARDKDDQTKAFFNEAYKQVTLTAPIEGEVIVATNQPGQSILTTAAAVVLSDRLVVRANVDETDVGKIKVGQNVILSVDAYEKEVFAGTVSHIYYESTTENNVTVYKVDITVAAMPSFCRSGMSATVNFVISENPQALLVPYDAVRRDGNSAYVMVRLSPGTPPVRKTVVTGINDTQNVEIVSGLNENEKVVVETEGFAGFAEEKKSFMARPGRGGKSKNTAK